MRLVCFTGIDGGGKTTLAKAVVSLTTKRSPAVYVYGRTFPVVSRLVMALGRVVFLRRRDVWTSYADYEDLKRSAVSNPFLAFVFRWAINFDYVPQIVMKLLPHMFSGRLVVLDRYVYDTVISDLAVHLGYTPAETMRAIGRYLAVLPVPAITFLVDLDEEVAFSRKTDVPHVDYLVTRRQQYLHLAGRKEVVVLDGASSMDELIQAAIGHIQASRRLDS
jgi:thymidylate kinase